METNNTLPLFRFVFYTDDIFIDVAAEDIFNATEKFKVCFGLSLFRRVTMIHKAN